MLTSAGAATSGLIGVRAIAFAALVATALLRAPDAEAHRNGIVARGCGSCHGGSASANIAVSADKPVIAPGDLVTLSVSITRPAIAVGGVFVADPGTGQLSVGSAEGMAPNSSGLTHTAPKPAQGGAVTFRFAWRAPVQPGATRFEVWGLGANGDGTSAGDAPGATVFAVVYGCTPQEYYFDADGDGFGAQLFPSTLACAGQTPPLGYASNHDDCDDTHDSAHPGAAELCNGRDDNCNGAVDEGTQPQALYPDEDGDGYYAAQSGAAVMGCPPLTGLAAEPGDCAPRDPARHPGALEVCNQLDDNCDGRIDERTRPQCGVGLCRRESVSCELADCMPGIPAPEVCDLLDNDCDGTVDGDAVCRSPSEGGTGGTPAAAGGHPSGAGPSFAGASGQGNASGGDALASGSAGTAGNGETPLAGQANPEASCGIATVRNSEIQVPHLFSFALFVLACSRRRQRPRRERRRGANSAEKYSLPKR